MSYAYAVVLQHIIDKQEEERVWKDTAIWNIIVDIFEVCASAVGYDLNALTKRSDPVVKFSG